MLTASLGSVLHLLTLYRACSNAGFTTLTLSLGCGSANDKRSINAARTTGINALMVLAIAILCPRVRLCREYTSNGLLRAEWLQHQGKTAGAIGQSKDVVGGHAQKAVQGLQGDNPSWRRAMPRSKLNKHNLTLADAHPHVRSASRDCYTRDMRLCWAAFQQCKVRCRAPPVFRWPGVDSCMRAATQPDMHWSLPAL